MMESKTAVGGVIRRPITRTDVVVIISDLALRSDGLIIISSILVQTQHSLKGIKLILDNCYYCPKKTVLNRISLFSPKN